MKRLLSALVAVLLAISLPANAVGTPPTLMPVQDGEAMVFLAEEDADNEWGSKANSSACGF